MLNKNAKLEITTPLKMAIDQTNALLLKTPNYQVLQNIKKQLDFISNFVRTETSPSQEDKTKVNIGIIAVREFELSLPNYAENLMKTKYYFDRL